MLLDAVDNEVIEIRGKEFPLIQGINEAETFQQSESQSDQEPASNEASTSNWEVTIPPHSSNVSQVYNASASATVSSQSQPTLKLLTENKPKDFKPILRTSHRSCSGTGAKRIRTQSDSDDEDQ